MTVLLLMHLVERWQVEVVEAGRELERLAEAADEGVGDERRAEVRQDVALERDCCASKGQRVGRELGSASRGRGTH